MCLETGKKNLETEEDEKCLETGKCEKRLETGEILEIKKCQEKTKSVLKPKDVYKQEKNKSV